MVKCVVNHCKNDAFIRFPHPTSSVFHKWLEVLGDRELKNLDPEAIYTDKRICHTHFNRQSRRKLDKAVPTLHLTQDVVQKKVKEDVRDEETEEEIPASSPQKRPRSQSLAVETVCRTCLAKDAAYNLFLSMYKGYSLIYLMEDHLNIKIRKCDGISSNICNNCLNKIQDFYNFTRQAQSAEMTLQSVKEEMRLIEQQERLKNPPVIIEYVKPLHDNDEKSYLCEEAVLRKDLHSITTRGDDNQIYDVKSEELGEEIIRSTESIPAVVEDKEIPAPKEDNEEIDESIPNADHKVLEKPTMDSTNIIHDDKIEVGAYVDYDVAIKENVLYNVHASEQQVYTDLNDLHVGQEIEVMASTPERVEIKNPGCDCCEATEYDSETFEDTKHIRRSKSKEWKCKALQDLADEEKKLQLLENATIDIAQVYLEEMLQKYNFKQYDEGTNTIVGFFALQKNGKSNTGQLQEVFGVTKRKLAQEIDDDPTVIFSYGDICKITLYDPRIGKVYIAIEQKIIAGETVKKNYVDILTSVFKYDVPTSIRKSKLIKIYYKLKTDRSEYAVSDLQEMDENLGVSVLARNNFPPSVDKRTYSKFHIYMYKIVNPFDEKSYYLFQITYNDYRDVLIPHLKEFHHRMIQHVFSTENIMNIYYSVANYNSPDFIKNFRPEQLIPVEKATMDTELLRKPIFDTNELEKYLRVTVYDISGHQTPKALICFKEDVTMLNANTDSHIRHWIATKRLFLRLLFNSDVPEVSETVAEKSRNEESKTDAGNRKCVILDNIILTAPQKQELLELLQSKTDITENQEDMLQKFPKITKNYSCKIIKATGPILITNEGSSEHVSPPQKKHNLETATTLIPFQKPKMVLVKTNELSRKLEIVSAVPEDVPSKNVTSLLSKNLTSPSSENITSLSPKNITSSSSKNITTSSSKNITSSSSKNLTSSSSKDITSSSLENITSPPSENITSLSPKNITSLSSKNITSSSSKNLTSSSLNNITSSSSKTQISPLKKCEDQDPQIIRKSDRRRTLNSKYFEEEIPDSGKNIDKRGRKAKTEDKTNLKLEVDALLEVRDRTSLRTYGSSKKKSVSSENFEDFVQANVPVSLDIDYSENTGESETSGNTENISIAPSEKGISSEELNIETNKLKEVSDDENIDAVTLRKENVLLLKTLKKISSVHKKEESAVKRTETSTNVASIERETPSGQLKIDTSVLKDATKKKDTIQSTADSASTEKENKNSVEKLLPKTSNVNEQLSPPKKEEPNMNKTETDNLKTEEIKEVSPKEVKIRNPSQQLTKKKDPDSQGTDRTVNSANTDKEKLSSEDLMVKISKLKDVDIVRMKKGMTVVPEKVIEAKIKLDEHLTKKRESLPNAEKSDCVEAELTNKTTKLEKVSPAKIDSKEQVGTSNIDKSKPNEKLGQKWDDKRSSLPKLFKIKRPKTANIRQRTVTSSVSGNATNPHDEKFLQSAADKLKINVPLPRENIEEKQLDNTTSITDDPIIDLELRLSESEDEDKQKFAKDTSILNVSKNDKFAELEEIPKRNITQNQTSSILASSLHEPEDNQAASGDITKRIGIITDFRGFSSTEQKGNSAILEAVQLKPKSPYRRKVELETNKRKTRSNTTNDKTDSLPSNVKPEHKISQNPKRKTKVQILSTNKQEDVNTSCIIDLAEGSKNNVEEPRPIKRKVDASASIDSSMKISAKKNKLNDQDPMITAQELPKQKTDEIRNEKMLRLPTDERTAIHVEQNVTHMDIGSPRKRGEFCGKLFDSIPDDLGNSKSELHWSDLVTVECTMDDENVKITKKSVPAKIVDNSKHEGTEIDKSFFLGLAPVKATDETIVLRGEISATQTDVQPNGQDLRLEKGKSVTIPSRKEADITENKESTVPVGEISTIQTNVQPNAQDVQLTKTKHAKRHSNPLQKKVDARENKRTIVLPGETSTIKTNVQPNAQDIHLEKGKQTKRLASPEKKVDITQKEQVIVGEISMIQTNVQPNAQDVQLTKGKRVKRHSSPSQKKMDVTENKGTIVLPGKTSTIQPNVQPNPQDLHLEKGKQTKRLASSEKKADITRKEQVMLGEISTIHTNVQPNTQDVQLAQGKRAKRHPSPSQKKMDATENKGTIVLPGKTSTIQPNVQPNPQDIHLEKGKQAKRHASPEKKADITRKEQVMLGEISMIHTNVQPNAQDIHLVKGKQAKRHASPGKKADITQNKQVIVEQISTVQTSVQPNAQDVQLAKGKRAKRHSSPSQKKLDTTENKGTIVLLGETSTIRTSVQPNAQDIHLEKGKQTKRLASSEQKADITEDEKVIVREIFTIQTNVQHNAQDVQLAKGKRVRRHSSPAQKKGDTTENKGAIVLPEETSTIQTNVQPNVQDINLVKGKQAKRHASPGKKAVITEDEQVIVLWGDTSTIQTNVQPNAQYVQLAKGKRVRRHSSPAQKKGDTTENKGAIVLPEETSTIQANDQPNVQDIHLVKGKQAKRHASPGKKADITEDEQVIVLWGDTSTIQTNVQPNAQDVQLAKGKRVRRHSSPAQKKGDTTENKGAIVLPGETSTIQANDQPNVQDIHLEKGKQTKRLASSEQKADITEDEKVIVREIFTIQTNVQHNAQDVQLAKGKRVRRHSSPAQKKGDTTENKGAIVLPEETSTIQANDQPNVQDIHLVKGKQAKRHASPGKKAVITEDEQVIVLWGDTSTIQTNVQPNAQDVQLAKGKRVRRHSSPVQKKGDTTENKGAIVLPEETSTIQANDQPNVQDIHLVKGKQAKRHASPGKKAVVTEDEQVIVLWGDTSTIQTNVQNNIQDLQLAKGKRGKKHSRPSQKKVYTTENKGTIVLPGETSTIPTNVQPNAQDIHLVKGEQAKRQASPEKKEDITEDEKVIVGETSTIQTYVQYNVQDLQLAKGKRGKKHSRPSQKKVDTTENKGTIVLPGETSTIPTNVQPNAHLVKGEQAKRHASPEKKADITEDEKVIVGETSTIQTYVQASAQDMQLAKGKRAKRHGCPEKKAVITEDEQVIVLWGDTSTIQTNVQYNVQDLQLAKGKRGKKRSRPSQKKVDTTENKGISVLPGETSTIPTNVQPNAQDVHIVKGERAKRHASPEKEADITEDEKVIVEETTIQTYVQASAQDVQLAKGKRAKRHGSPEKKAVIIEDEQVVVLWGDTSTMQTNVQHNVQDLQLGKDKRGKKHPRPDITVHKQTSTTPTNVQPNRQDPVKRKRGKRHDCLSEIQNQDIPETKETIVPEGEISMTQTDVQPNGQDIQFTKYKTPDITSSPTKFEPSIETPTSSQKKHRLIVKIEQSEIDAVLEKLKPVYACRTKYACKRCSKVFKSSKYLLKHIRRQHHKFGIKCLQCKEKFLSYKAIVKHVYEKHEDRRLKSLWCQRCGSSLRSFTSMEEHKRAVHSCPMKKYKCIDCPRRFLTMTLLKIHMLGL